MKETTQIERAGGGCPPPPCSTSSITDETDSDVEYSSVVEASESMPAQSDPCQLAGEQLAHGYESPQVGLPHQAVRELLGASQSHPSSQRIVPPIRLGSGS